MGADEIQAMLGALQTSPDDHELRSRAAEALDAAGKRDEALELLAPLVNVTGHDDDAGLPCLCKTCLPRAGQTAESAGMPFQRSFAIVRNRVLHFWMLSELAAERAGVRKSVAEALRVRLAPRKA
jgi:Flp pilus assembly protein TadD